MWGIWGSYIWFAVAHLVHDLTVHHLPGHLDVVLRGATIPCQPSPLCQALKLRNVKEWRKQKRKTHWPVEKLPKKKFVPLPTYAFPALFALKLVLHTFLDLNFTMLIIRAKSLNIANQNSFKCIFVFCSLSSEFMKSEQTACFGALSPWVMMWGETWERSRKSFHQVFPFLPFLTTLIFSSSVS